MNKYFIGWDVGAWYCDNNAKSKDALVILDSDGEIMGTPWRGSLSDLINTELCLEKFLEQLFKLCEASDKVASDNQICLAIDTPLGFPVGFRNLINNGITEEISNLSQESKESNRHIHNPYLYRKTEEVIYGSFGKVPLSPIQHMIGAQATKGLHFLNQFQLKPDSLGFWEKDRLTVIEAYPATVNNSNQALQYEPATLLNLSPEEKKDEKLYPSNQDRFDAYKCAVVAKAFIDEKNPLIAPEGEIDMSEGWIWTFDIKISE